MTKCSTIPINFTASKRHLVQMRFYGGDITGNGGSVLLREIYLHLMFISSLAYVLEGVREKKKVQHDYRRPCLGTTDLSHPEVFFPGADLSYLPFYENKELSCLYHGDVMSISCFVTG